MDTETLVAINHLTDAISAARIPISERLWDYEDVAAYFRCSVSNVRQNIAPHPKFPRAYRLPTGKHPHPLYKAAEVIEFAELWKGAA